MKPLILATTTLVGVFAFVAACLLQPEPDLATNIARDALVEMFRNEENPADLGRERFRGWADGIAKVPLRVSSDGIFFLDGIRIDLKEKSYRFMVESESCDYEYAGHFAYQGGRWRAFAPQERGVYCHKGINRPRPQLPQPEDVR